MYKSDKPDSKAGCSHTLTMCRPQTCNFLTPERARDEGLHTNRRSINTRFREVMILVHILKLVNKYQN